MTTPYDSNNKYKIRDDHRIRYEHMTNSCPPDGRVVLLSKGFVAWVSPEDIDRVMNRHWHLKGNGLSVYAMSTDYTNHDDGRKLMMHHYIIGKMDGWQVDHINGNTLDNRRGNLRFVIPRLNCLNRHLGPRGVTQHKTDSGRKTGKWRSGITVNGRWRNLGIHETYEGALKARIDAGDAIINGMCVNYTDV